MEDLENYKGYLLAAHPKREDPTLKKGVILIIDHDHTGSIGLQINKPMEGNTTLGGVMNQMGMLLDKDQPVFFGGPENTNRIIVLHTLDWSSSGTTKLGDNYGITNDLSVLAAMAENQGPEHVRAIAGYIRWLPGHLEGEIDISQPWNNISKSWSIIEANLELLFAVQSEDQWHQVIEESAKIQIANWF